MMKSRINALQKFFGIMYKRLHAIKLWQHALTSERAMIGYLNRLAIIVLGSSGTTWILAFVAFARYCFSVKKHQGLKGLAITLKVSHTILVKHCAGAPIKGVASSLGHRVRTSGGLPFCIPKVHRREITRGSGNYIKV